MPRPPTTLALLRTSLLALGLAAPGCAFEDSPPEEVGSVSQAGVVACEVNADCDDGNPCTNDVCFSTRCGNPSNANLCRASTAACDPAEYCSYSACPADINSCPTPPGGGGGTGTCDEDVGCTTDGVTDPNVEPPPPSTIAPTRGSSIQVEAFYPMKYHNGPVMNAKNNFVNVYLIFYGSWSSSSISLLQQFVNALNGSTYMNTITSYWGKGGDRLGNKVYLKGTWQAGAPYGKALGRKEIIKTVIDSFGRFGKDPVGVYFVLSGADVTPPSKYCELVTHDRCGEHNQFVTSISTGNIAIKYAYVPHVQSCSEVQTWCTDFLAKNLPHNDYGADVAADKIAHELAEAITDPRGGAPNAFARGLDAWHDDEPGHFNEEADRCNMDWVNLNIDVSPDGRGYYWNVALGGQKWLIQGQWWKGHSRCVLSAPEETDPVQLSPAQEGMSVACPADPVVGSATCGDATVDLASDPQNCGACGHSCLGGTCSAGACSATPLYTGNLEPGSRLGIYSGRAYFSDGIATTRWVQLDGTLGTYRTGENAPSLLGVTPSGYGIWSTGSGTSFRVRKSTGTGTQSGPIVATPITGLAATSSNVYFSAGDTLRILNSSLGQVNQVVAHAPRGIRAIGSDVYWADQEAGAIFYRGGSGKLCAIAVDQVAPAEVAIAGGHVYWTTSDGISRAPLATCGAEAEAIVSGLSCGDRAPTSIAVDSTEALVYWTDASRAYRAPAVAEAAPQQLTPDLANLRAAIGLLADRVVLLTDTQVLAVPR